MEMFQTGEGTQIYFLQNFTKSLRAKLFEVGNYPLIDVKLVFLNICKTNIIKTSKP